VFFNRKKWRIIASGLLTAGATAISTQAGIDFEQTVLPLLQEKCFRCHSGRVKKPDAALRFDDAERFKSGSYYGEVLVPGQPEASVLLERITLPHDDKDFMPPAGKGDPCTPEQIEIIRQWITEGARFGGWQRVEKPKAAARPKKKNTNSRLSIKNYGKNPSNPGLDLAPSPTYPPKLSPKLVKAKAGQIDALVDAHRKEHGVKALARAEDRVFVRRAYLGIAGRTPTLDESLSFLASRDRRKRTQLIDRLIGTEGYVNHWFHFWADLLKVRSVQFTSAVYYAEWIKQALRDNMPYDRFAFELITATGMPHQNGATGWTASDANMAPDHLANTMQAFLGQQLQCAQCHDHPYDRWTQYEFQSMASYYAGVRWNGVANKHFQRQIEKEGLKDSISEKQFKYFGNNQGNNYRYAVWEPAFTQWNLLPRDYQYADAKPRQPVPPRVIYGEQPVIKDSPREAFGRWVTGRDNEWFTKSIANRLWHETMGVGLIEPVDNIKYDTEAQIPQLMDLLAELMQEVDYNLKDFLRILYNTKTWQLATLTEDLPEDLSTYHYDGRPLMRMSGEQIWDSFISLAIIDPDDRKGHGSRFTSDEERMRIEKMYTSSIQENLALYTDEYIDAERARRNKEQKEAVKLFGAKQNNVRMKIMPGKGNRGFNTWSLDHMTDPRWHGMDRGLVRAAELPSPAESFHFVRQFGQSDRKIIGEDRRDPNVTQVLTLLNGPVHTVLDAENSVLARQMAMQQTPEEKINVLFRSILTRNPTAEDVQISLDVLTANPGKKGYRMILWALLNTREFMFIQ
jgi:hypothetical protein